MFEKYYKYLEYHHSWQCINCLTLIEKIYKDNLDIDFSDQWKRAGRMDGTSGIDSSWPKKFKDAILSEKINWVKISLTELKEYDILAFVNRKNIPFHFGCYISNNKFIHAPRNSNINITDLNDYYREWMTYEYTDGGAYRHKYLV